MPAFCTSCGAPLKAEDRFCTHCGAAVSEQSRSPAPDAPTPTAPPTAEAAAPYSHAHGPIGLMAAVVGVGLVAGAVYWSLRKPAPPPIPPAASTAAGPVVSQAPAPPTSQARSEAPSQVPQVVDTPSSARAPTIPVVPRKGVWVFSSDEDGVQLMFKDSQAAEDAKIRFVCNLDDGVVWTLSRAVLDDRVEVLASQPQGLDMTIVGESESIVARGYPTSAPGETALAWETPRNLALMRAFTAPAFAIHAPGLSTKAASGDHAENLSAFARACPPVDTDASDKLGWGTQTSRRYGYRLDIPKGLLRIVAGDRFVRRYASDSGDSELVVQNRTNATDQSLRDAIVDETPKFEKLVYQRRTKEFVVLSGYSGDRIIYYKARTSCRGANIVSFTLSYKIQSREVYDAIAARMSKSFDRTASTDGAPICP